MCTNKRKPQLKQQSATFLLVSLALLVRVRVCVGPDLLKAGCLGWMLVEVLALALACLACYMLGHNELQIISKHEIKKISMFIAYC